MELSWLMRLRIAAAMAVGVVLIGVLAWPLAAPSDPSGAVFFGTLSIGCVIVLAVLAFLAGLIGYFVSWPFGREIGVLAVPAGLGVWALRSGTVANLIQQLRPHDVAQRQALFAALRWEPPVWLAIVAAGFAGVLVGQKIRSRAEPDQRPKKSASKRSVYLNGAIALVGSVLITQLFIRLFAQDVGIPDRQLGSVVAQPPVGQIAFAVVVSFGLAAFVFKKFLDVSYVWPTIASGLVTGFAMISHVRQDVLQHVAENWPAGFFANSVVSILPVQMVAFGTLGSIVGYWLGVRYNYWRRYGHEGQTGRS